MIGADRLVSARQDEPDPVLPPLPTEGHMVGAALAANDAKASLGALLLLLQHCPRAHDDISRTFGEVQTQLSASWKAYCDFREVLSCQGRA